MDQNAALRDYGSWHEQRQEGRHLLLIDDVVVDMYHNGIGWVFLFSSTEIIMSLVAAVSILLFSALLRPR